MNEIIKVSECSDECKKAMVIKRAVSNENNRPISSLPILSKLYERAINTQLMDFFESKCHAYLSAFRPGYGI